MPRRGAKYLSSAETSIVALSVTALGTLHSQLVGSILEVAHRVWLFVAERIRRGRSKKALRKGLLLNNLAVLALLWRCRALDSWGLVDAISLDVVQLRTVSII